MYNGADIVILAAGKSSRFESSYSKLLHKLEGLEIINHVVSAAVSCDFNPIVVVGHQKDLVIEAIEKAFPGICTFVEQKNLRGTGDAFFASKDCLKSEQTLVVNGDVPLISGNLLLNFYNYCISSHSSLGVVVTTTPKPFGYGRIVHIEDKNVVKTYIIEENDASEEQKKISLINGGIYFFSKQYLDKELCNFYKNKFKSRYNTEIKITDLFNWGAANNYKEVTFVTDAKYVRGVNTLEEYYQIQL